MGGALLRVVGLRWGRVTLGVLVAAACAVTVAAGVGTSAPSDVLGVRLGGDQVETRVVVDLKTPVSGALAAGPGRIDLVLKGASAAAPIQGAGRGLVRDWSVDRASGGARLTLDLAAQAQVRRRFLLPPADGVANYRYVVDIAAQAPEAAALPAVAPAPVAAPPHARKVIVLDPGHGGKDPGAQGQGYDEKTLTLAAALALKDRLERTGRYQVVMTRASDEFISLEDRVQIARSAGADLFLSLHADSGPDRATHGATVYTLSEKGETRVGYVLSRHEWFLMPTTNNNDQAVGQILLDLTQRSTRNRSAIFAQDLIERVGDAAPLVPRSQRDANYFVLLAPDVPAALLEMGFITNAADASRLNNERERAALADRIAQAIDAYFATPTRFAAR
jgi:N-acetylmuramoyl-L-alanine amidase